MRESELRQECDRLELILVETSGERTFVGATLDELTDIDVIVTLLKFYIKIGFSHSRIEFSTGNFKVTYIPSQNKLYVTEGNDAEAQVIDVEKWGSEQ